MDVQKTYLRVPLRPHVTVLERAFWKLFGGVLSPTFLALAYFCRAPGLVFRCMSAELGVDLLLRRRAPIHFVTIFDLFFMPMDSTRYFEFDFAWRMLSDEPCEHYLDVSSPRLFPIVFLRKHPRISAHLINPDKQDLAETIALIRANGLACELNDCRITDAPFAPHSFDVITCISVLEHIPDDVSAVKRMWQWLKPNGKLVLTVPCAAQASEQYIDRNEYGVLQPDASGFVFWQRLYDTALLRQRLLNVIGEPKHYRVYGEKKAGAFFKNAERKRANSDTYAFWREPYMMAREYRYFDSVADLPGEGVMAMEFVKP